MGKGETTYNQQIAFCGKARCRKCREGIGHGPYWYAYQTVNGRTTRTYVGKSLPPHIRPQREPEEDQTLLRVWLLGTFRMQRRTAPHHAWQNVPDSVWSVDSSARNLLAYLISRPARRANHQRIQEALWPHVPPEANRTQLERATATVQQAIESSRTKRQSILRCETELLTLADQHILWSDVDAFTISLKAIGKEPSNTTEQAVHYEEILALYKGDFLPEEQSEWANTYRHTLRQRYDSTVLALADLYIDQERLIHAIDLLDDLLATNPAHEAAVQRLMIALAHMMRRGEAQRLYQRFTDVLQREYATTPSQETRLLYDALQHGETLPVSSTLTKLSQQQQAPSPAAAIGRTHHTSLVGRADEWMRLQTLLQQTEDMHEAQPHSIVLLGEAGIGKTRLAEELARAMQQKRWTIIWDQAYPQEQTIPYRPWIEIFRQTLAQGIWQREMVSQRPLLFQALAPLLPELSSPQMPLPPLSPEHEQLRLWEAVRELLTLISSRTPCLIVLDDLHWADNRSCELLAYLARHLRGSSIAIIATCRDNEWQSNHHLRSQLIDLQREHAVETIHLHPLDNEDMTTLVSQLLDHSLPLIEHIRERARGNPFFAEELAHNVEARRNTASISDLASLPLPETITALLDQRLSQLSQPCQKLLYTAAVLGYSFPLQRISAMEDASTGDHLLDLLEEAVQAGILTEEGTGSRIVYRFWHPLFQSYLYERLSAVRRARLHYRTALMLQTLYQNHLEEEAATITQHLISGGAEPQHIAHYAALAGHRAYRLSAYAEADQQYQLALDHLILIAQPDQTTQECLLWTLIGLGECKRIQGNAQEARSLYERGLSLNTPLLAEQELQMRALLWCEIGLTWYDAQQLARAQQCYLDGEQVLQGAGIESGPGLARLRYEQGYASWRQGNYEQARKQANEALHVFEALLTQDPIQQDLLPPLRLCRTLRGDPVDIGRTHMLIGLIESSAGHTKKALGHLHNTLTYFEQHNCLRELAITCCNLGDLHLRRSELAAAQLILRRGLHLAEQMGDTPLRAYILGNLGILHLRLGSLVEAETHCQQALALCEQIQDEVAIGQWTVYAAIAIQEQGRLTDAERLLLRALKQARVLQLPYLTGLTFVALGCLRLRQAIQAQEQQAPVYRWKPLAHKARQVVQKALQLEGLEAETRTEGHLIHAYALLLLGEVDLAKTTASHAQQEAQAAGLRGLSAQTHSLLSAISMQQGATAEAQHYSAQATRHLRSLDMQLEYARALYQQGCLLIQQEAPESACYQRGITYLQQAQQGFLTCQAAADSALVARHLTRLQSAPTQAQ